MTKDGATLRITLSVMSRIADARTFYMAQARPESSGSWAMSSLQAIMSMQGLGAASRVEVQAQILLRDWVTVRTLAQAMEERAALAAAIVEPLREAAKEEGAELLDLNISGNIRAAYSDLLKAQLEGEAALQRARNEAATMRNLLNTARLVRDHPGLLELRALTSGQKPRVNVVINQAPPSGEAVAEVTGEGA
jgi:regulator of protease activity HflC (stomatin/prohibitin superfamily)